MVYELTSTSPRRRRKRKARKDWILREALHLVGRDGLAALTVGKLAEELDYTPGALYRYFPSKGALVAELEAGALAAIQGRLEQELFALEKEAPDEPQVAALLRLLAAAEVYVRLLDEAREEAVLIAALMGEQRRLVDEGDAIKVAPAFSALLLGVEKLFDDASTCGALTPGSARERTLVYWASIQGVVQLDKLSYLGAALFDPRRLGPETARALLCGWGADPDRLERARSLLQSRRRDHVD